MSLTTINRNNKKPKNETLYTTGSNYLLGIIMARVVTSIRVDDGLWKEAKIYAIRKEITLTELIEKLLREELTRSGFPIREVKA